MKKLLSLLLAVLLLAGCDLSHPPPPLLSDDIVFESEEELQALLDAAALSDAEFEAFMTQNADVSSYQEIEDKSVAAELSALIQAVGVPVLLNKDLLENYAFTYWPQKQVYDVKYYINGMRYRFVYAPFEEYSTVFKLPVAFYDLDGAQLTMYKLEDDNVGNERIFANVYANGYRIQIVVNYADKKAVDFTPFTWSTEMQYMK